MAGRAEKRARQLAPARRRIADDRKDGREPGRAGCTRVRIAARVRNRRTQRRGLLREGCSSGQLPSAVVSPCPTA